MIEFSITLIKTHFLKYAKEFNRQNQLGKLNTTHIGLLDLKSPIYVAEHLTHQARRLFFAARNFAKMNNFA